MYQGGQQFPYASYVAVRSSTTMKVTQQLGSRWRPFRLVVCMDIHRIHHPDLITLKRWS